MFVGLGCALIFITQSGVLVRSRDLKEQNTAPKTAYICWKGECSAQFAQSDASEQKNSIVRTAQTPEDRERGLSGTESLAPYVGMLFIFPTEGQYSFWMKDMKYPIDIVWISAEKSIVHIEVNAKPEDFPKTYMPPKNAQYVLELPQGDAEKRGLTQGSLIDFSLSK